MKNFFKTRFAPVLGNLNRARSAKVCKRSLRPLLITALVAVIGFSMAACGDNPGGGGGGTGGGPRTVTYSGTASGNTYTLKIIENMNNPNRAALTDPLPGDSFEFTMKDSSNAKKTSTGEVKSVSGNEFTMLPSNAATPQTTFTTTVSDEGLTAMSGTFTWTDNSTSTRSGTLTPSGGPGTVTPPVTGGGTVYYGTTLAITNEQVYAMNDQGTTVTYTPYTGNLTLQPGTSGISGTATITNGKLSFSIGIPDTLSEWSVFSYAYSQLYNNVTASDTSVKLNLLSDFDAAPNYTLNREKITRGGTSGTSEDVFYIYVDKNVTISGTGKTTTLMEGISTTTTNFSLALKTGWNAVYQKATGTYSGNTLKSTQTWTLGNPSGINWVLEDEDDED